MAAKFHVTHKVQEDPVHGIFKVPILKSPRVVIIYSNDTATFVTEVSAVLSNTYQVVGHNVETPTSDEQLFQDFRSCSKALLIISM